LLHQNPALYGRVALHLVEASDAARQAHRTMLGDVEDRLRSSSPTLPTSFEGVLVANELLDALPCHRVVMRADGLREIYVDVAPRGDERGSRDDIHFVSREGPLSTPALSRYLAPLGVALEPGWFAEINLQAVDWVREAARRLRRGFIVLIDYGHEAQELYSASHSHGTLTSFSRHTSSGTGLSDGRPVWLESPGEQDLTAHVDFTSIRAAAEHEGLVTLGFLDQTYFLLGLLERSPVDAPTLHERLALKTLLMPGGLGSTHKVMIFGKDVGRPVLSGCSFGERVT
jgi:SAM-dependent MidA family methyltransferase